METEMFFPAHSRVTVLWGKTGFTCRMEKKTFRNVLTSSTTGRLASYSHNGFHLGYVICIYIDLFLLFLLLSLSLDDIAPKVTVTSFWCLLDLKGHSAGFITVLLCRWEIFFIIKAFELSKSNVFCEPSVLLEYINVTDAVSFGGSSFPSELKKKP